MLRVRLLLCLLACGVCESSPVRHRRPIRTSSNDANNVQDTQSGHDWRAHSGSRQQLLDVSGLYTGTWTKLQQPHSSSSSSDDDAAASSPGPLLHSVSGPLMMHLTAGPTHPHELTAAVQGVVRLSEGSLIVGRPLQQQLQLSGVTKTNTNSHMQELHAVLQPQYPIISQQSATTTTSSSSSTGADDQLQSVSFTHWLRYKQRRQQQQQWMRMPPTKHQIWLRGRKGPLVPVSPRGPRTRLQGPVTSGTASDTAAEASGTGIDDDTDTDTAGDNIRSSGGGSSSSSGSSSAVWGGPHRGLSSSPEEGTSGVKCRFRLQLSVTTAPHAQPAAAAAAVTRDLSAGRGIKGFHTSDLDLGTSENLNDLDDIISDHHDHDHESHDDHEFDNDDDDVSDDDDDDDDDQQQLDYGDGETPVDDGSASGPLLSLFRLRQQHAFGLMQVLEQQQQQQQHVDSRSTAEKHILDSSAAAAAAGENGVHQHVNAPSTDESQLPPLEELALPEAVLAASSSSREQHTLRTLHSRSFPGFSELHTVVSNAHNKKNNPAPAAAEHASTMHERQLISDDDDHSDNAQSADSSSSSQSQPSTAAAAVMYSSIGPETRQAPQSLIDYWVLPCSHPQQQHTPRCWQQRRQQQQQRLIIQGLLLSDNCNASWSLTAVALPPGGLQHQAMCYAVGALLLCILQVIALRRQARAAAASPAAALKVSLLGVCGGAQLDACLSMAHLAAALAAADVSVPLLVVAAAQFAIFAGADMTLMLHVWRAHNNSSRRQRQQRQQQQQQQQLLLDIPAAAVAEIELATAPLLPAGWSRPLSTTMAAVAAAAAAQLQQQAEGLRGFMGSSSGSSLVDALLSGLMQLVTGQSLLLLYIRFYLVLVTVVVISWLLVSQLPLLLLLAFSMWLPQLMHNIQHSTKHALLPAYIVAATAARLMLPLYLLSCPNNMLQTSPQPWLAGGLLLWVGLQVLLLLLQHYCGPHVLLPPSWTPERYNYHRIEMPWQFKQQLAEMRKLEQCQEQHNATLETAAAAVSAAAGSSVGDGRYQCRCDHLVSGAGRTVWDLHNRQAAAVDSWQQHWCLAAAAGSSTCCCQYRCIHDQSATTAFSPTSARPLYRVSSSSSSNYWQQCTSSSSNALSPSQQQQGARLHWAAPGPDSGSAQQRIGSPGYCSDACYISMLGAAAAALAAPAAASSTMHEPLRQQRHNTSSHHTGTYSCRCTVQQQHHCCCLPYHSAQQPASTRVDASIDPYHLRPTAAASSSSSSSSYINAPSGCIASPHQAWPACQAPPQDNLLHDVIESYDAVSGQGYVECVICMAAVSLLPAAGRCVTPCGHFFHTDCLASWIEVKAECPTCRGPLPPLS